MKLSGFSTCIYSRFFEVADTGNAQNTTRTMITNASHSQSLRGDVRTFNSSSLLDKDLDFFELALDFLDLPWDLALRLYSSVANEAVCALAGTLKSV